MVRVGLLSALLAARGVAWEDEASLVQRSASVDVEPLVPDAQPQELWTWDTAFVDADNTNDTKVYQSLTRNFAEGIPVFYHIAVDDFIQTKRIVDEQVTALKTAPMNDKIGDVYYITSSNRYRINNFTKGRYLAHAPVDGEQNAMRLLHTYCRKNPEDKVIYVHSLGSSLTSANNNHHRQFPFKAALSDECSNMPDGTCNMCSARFAPLTTAHSPGNMWVGHCSYISKLLSPYVFKEKLETALDSFRLPIDKRFPTKYGLGSMLWAHWAYSHPDVLPCDVYGGNYATGTWGIPKEQKKWRPSLKRAPRFSMKSYGLGCDHHWTSEGKLWEYRHLYGHEPGAENDFWSLYKPWDSYCEWYFKLFGEPVKLNITETYDQKLLKMVKNETNVTGPGPIKL